MIKIAVVYHSQHGHTKALAESVNSGAASVTDCESQLIPVEELPPPDDKHKFSSKWDALNAADAIVFGSATYMGSVSAELKRFMESSSSLWFQQAWKDKIAGGFTNSGGMSGDKLNTMIDLVVFAGQHSMIWISQGIMVGNQQSDAPEDHVNRLSSWLGAMSQSNQGEGSETAPPRSDRLTGELYGRRVAEAAKRWH